MKGKTIVLMLCTCLTTFSSGCIKARYSLLDTSDGPGLLFAALVLTQIRYVAVGASCSIWTSENGSRWTDRTTLPGCTTGAAVHAVAYGNGQWVAVGDATGTNTGCGIWTSPDARVWTQQTCGSQVTTPSPLRSISYGILSGKPAFIAGAYISVGSMFHAQTSFDGINWVQATTFGGGLAGDYISGTAIVNGRGYAVQSNASTTGSTTDGSAWGTLANNPTTLNGPRFIGAGSNNRVIAYAGFSTGSLQYTDDVGATVWPSGASAGFASYLTGMARKNNLLLFLAGTCNMAHSYDNGASFEAPNTGVMTNCSGIDWKSVVHDPTSGAFTAAGSQGGVTRFARSETGGRENWTILSFSDNFTVNGPAVRL